MPRGLGLLALIALAFALAPACDRSSAERGGPSHAESEAPRRIVAIGDLHGDLAATRRALRLAGAIDADDHYRGGELIIVQVGDRLDRGDDELAILSLFKRISEDARAQGGAVHTLLGNHEAMNVMGDLRYVTRAGFAEFDSHRAAPPDPLPAPYASLPAFALGRALAFRPGGEIARSLASDGIALEIDGNVFVHGGLLPKHARRGIEAMNRDVMRYLRGEAPPPEDLLTSEDSPLWLRRFADDPSSSDCAVARETLRILGAKRMVVGHTVQQRGIAAYCDGAVWAIDVGMSAYYGGPTEVLELRGDRVRALRSTSAIESRHDVAR